MNIIQGSNAPIILEFDIDVSSITDFSAILIPKYGLKLDKSNVPILKKWNLEDIEIDQQALILPLTQEETLEFPAKPCYLDCKFILDSNIEFIDSCLIEIYKSADSTIMKVEEE